jgi:hypothetical protein
MRDVRLELLLKLYFLGEDDPEAERELLHRQIAACEEYLGRIETPGTTTPTGLGRLVSMSRASAAEATIRWLKDYAGALSGEHGAAKRVER